MKEIEEIRDRWSKVTHVKDGPTVITIHADIAFLLSHISTLEERVKELLENRSNILVEMNKQIVERDIALEQAESHLKRLEQAVDKHRIDVWGDDLVGHHADEELYKLRKEES